MNHYSLKPNLKRNCSKCTWILPVALVLVALVVGLLLWKFLSKKKQNTEEMKMVPVEALQNPNQVVKHAEQISSKLMNHSPNQEYPHMQQNPYARTQHQQQHHHQDTQNSQPVSAFGHSGAMQYTNDMFETAHIRGPGDSPPANQSQSSIDRSFAKSPHGHAQQLNSQQFQDSIQKSSCVVAFMSTECGHCEEIKPKYHEAATMARLPFYYVITESDPQPANHYGIRGFPTILRFEKGEPAREYNGDRSVESLVAFGSN